MSSLITYAGHLLLVDGKLADSTGCCCGSGVECIPPDHWYIHDIDYGIDVLDGTITQLDESGGVLNDFPEIWETRTRRYSGDKGRRFRIDFNCPAVGRLEAYSWGFDTYDYCEIVDWHHKETLPSSFTDPCCDRIYQNDKEFTQSEQIVNVFKGDVDGEWTNMSNWFPQGTLPDNPLLKPNYEGEVVVQAPVTSNCEGFAHLLYTIFELTVENGGQIGVGFATNQLLLRGDAKILGTQCEPGLPNPICPDSQGFILLKGTTNSIFDTAINYGTITANSCQVLQFFNESSNRGLIENAVVWFNDQSNNFCRISNAICDSSLLNATTFFTDNSINEVGAFITTSDCKFELNSRNYGTVQSNKTYFDNSAVNEMQGKLIDHNYIAFNGNTANFGTLAANILPEPKIEFFGNSENRGVSYADMNEGYIIMHNDSINQITGYLEGAIIQYKNNSNNMFNNRGVQMVEFYNDAVNNGSVNIGVFAPVFFNDDSINKGSSEITTFNNNSINDNLGTLLADSTFNDSSINKGTAQQNAIFNNNSRNEGTVINTATFNDASCNSATGTAGTFIPDPPPPCP